MPHLQNPLPDGAPRPGDIIAGKYRVARELGRGGMGVVLAAEHIDLRRRVAIKLLLPEARKLPTADERFLREARAAAAIQSQHVACILDVGRLPDQSPYLVMEHLVGMHFGKLIRSRAPLPLDEATRYMLEACEALGEAHALGIVHRDIKPGNLFLAERVGGAPVVKVLDFGLSKPVRNDGALEESLTATDLVAGSPHYMPPEQLRSLKLADARADIWALGVIFYQLLTGRRPFEGTSTPDVFAAILVHAPAPLQSLRPDLPRAAEAIILACLEKDVDKRIQTIPDLTQALRALGSTPAITSPKEVSSALVDLHAPHFTTETTTTVLVSSARRPGSRRRRSVAVVAGVGVAITILTGLLVASKPLSRWMNARRSEALPVEPATAPPGVKALPTPSETTAATPPPPDTTPSPMPVSTLSAAAPERSMTPQTPPAPRPNRTSTPAPAPPPSAPPPAAKPTIDPGDMY